MRYVDIEPGGLRIERKLGQKIEITHEGKTITVQIYQIQGERVKVALKGDPSFQVWRPDGNRGNRK